MSNKEPMMNIMNRIRLAWRVLTYKPGNLIAHAQRELGKGFDIELQEILLVFSSQGHSGMSAAITTSLVEKLMRFEPIGPLTGADSEWNEFEDGLFQNNRCSHVFKDATRFDGQAYDIDAIIWRDPDGTCCTNGESAQPIIFPYSPQREYRDRPAEAEARSTTNG